MNVFCAYDELVSVSELKPNPRNPNQHPEEQIELLAKIIKYNGWRAPITVSTRSGYIVRGHGRLQAAIKAGIDKCPIDYQDYESEEAEIADLLADNRIAELSFNDDDALQSLLDELNAASFDLELSGYDASFIDEFEDVIIKEDEIPEIPKEPICKNGEIWRLGDHFLMCGDSTNKEHVYALMKED